MPSPRGEVAALPFLLALDLARCHVAGRQARMGDASLQWIGSARALLEQALYASRERLPRDAQNQPWSCKKRSPLGLPRFGMPIRTSVEIVRPLKAVQSKPTPGLWISSSMTSRSGSQKS